VVVLLLLSLLSLLLLLRVFQELNYQTRKWLATLFKDTRNHIYMCHVEK